jgi:hypothetical protein
VFECTKFRRGVTKKNHSTLIKESGVRYKSILSNFCQVACQFIHVCYRIQNSTYPSYFLILLIIPLSADIISAKGAPVPFSCALACLCALLAFGRYCGQKKTLLVTNHPASGIAYTTKAGECRDVRLDGRYLDMLGKSVHVHSHVRILPEHQVIVWYIHLLIRKRKGWAR